ncbi:MAG TPA: hypothetical protein PJ990_11195 [Saprospiraceae bacterium]|nr:hypothetical protein [Saprospiraceae bacterium]
MESSINRVKCTTKEKLIILSEAEMNGVKVTLKKLIYFLTEGIQFLK